MYLGTDKIIELGNSAEADSLTETELTPEENQWCKKITRKNFGEFWEKTHGKDSLENEIVADKSEHSVFDK